MERQDYIVHLFDGASLEFDDVSYAFNESFHFFVRGNTLVGMFALPSVIAIINLNAMSNIPDDVSSLTT